MENIVKTDIGCYVEKADLGEPMAMLSWGNEWSCFICGWLFFWVFFLGPILILMSHSRHLTEFVVLDKENLTEEEERVI